MSVVSPPDKSRIIEVDTDSMIYSAAASMSASEKETISLAQASFLLPFRQLFNSSSISQDSS